MSRHRDEPLGLLTGDVVFGIRRMATWYAVVRVTQLMTRQKEQIVWRGLTEQAAEREAMRRNDKRSAYLLAKGRG